MSRSRSIHIDYISLLTSRLRVYIIAEVNYSQFSALNASSRDLNMSKI